MEKAKMKDFYELYYLKKIKKEFDISTTNRPVCPPTNQSNKRTIICVIFLAKPKYLKFN